MTLTTGNPALESPSAAEKTSRQEWVQLHVPRFHRMRPRYLAYEAFLESVLKECCRRVAPLAIVQARAKGVSSFAEKILRKRKDYIGPVDPPLPPDPLVRLTDLCGGRVITQTSAQAKAVCQWIERCFDIDWANSDDASTRLRRSEFGYRTVNYIVMANPEKLAAAGFSTPVPPDILGPVCPETAEPARLKAEIQVRTLLEHAYADIGHDLTYKTEVRVPDRIHRAFSAVAALLETADKEFARLIEAMEEFRSNYGAYHTREQVVDEIARLRVVLACDPDNLSQAVRIATLCHAIGDHEQVVEVLAPFRKRPHRGVQEALGRALTLLHWETPGGREFREGLEFLQAACRHGEKDPEILCHLAECRVHRDEDLQAAEGFREALAVDASEPSTLCRYLEFEAARQSSDTVIRLAEPMIRAAMGRCATQIEGRVNLPQAWGCLALLRLLLGEGFGALDALAHLLDLCERPSAGTAGRVCAAGRAVRRLRTALAHLRCIREKLPGFDWLERATLLGLATRMGDADALAELRGKASWRGGEPAFRPDERTVIVSGGCAPETEPLMPPFRKALGEALDGLPLTVIGGGTRMGISGVVGSIAERSDGRLRAVGYLPGPMAKALAAAKHTTGFAPVFASEGTEFTPLEPLQGWTDLIAAGVDPSRVKLLAYAGGSISRTECAVALALGARVGVVGGPDLPPQRGFRDPAWREHPRCLPLPLDAMTLRAFLRIDVVPLSPEDRQRLEPAARQAHEEYTRSAMPTDLSLQPWEQLDEQLKLSNFHQVSYWENVLKEFGLRIRRLSEADKQRPPVKMEDLVGRDGVRKLAEMEHGRWNVERLALGWRYAREKDVARRLSPYLIPWDLVPPAIQAYDIDAVVGLPGKLRRLGLELTNAQTEDRNRGGA